MTALLIAIGVVIVVVLVAALAPRRPLPAGAPVAPLDAALEEPPPEPTGLERADPPPGAGGAPPAARRRRLLAEPEPEPEPEPAHRTAAAWAASGASSAAPSRRCAAARSTPATWDSLEEALIRADVGVQTTDALLKDLRARVDAKEIASGDGPPVGSRRRDPGAARRARVPPAALRRHAGRRRRLARGRGQRRRARRPRSASWPASSRPPATRSCWPPGTRSGPRPPTSWACGPSDPGWTSSGAPREATPAPSSSTPCSGRRPGATTSCWPTPPAGCTTRSTWSRSSRRSAASPIATRAT